MNRDDEPNRGDIPVVPRAFFLRLLISAVFVFASSFGGTLRGEPLDGALLSRLKTEGVEALRRHAGKIGDVHLKWIASSGNDSTQFEFYSQGKNYLLRAESLASADRDGVSSRSYRFVKNRSFFFELSRNTESGPWKIDSYSKVRDGGENPALETVKRHSPYYVESRPLAEFLEDADLKITRIGSNADRGEETVTVDFETPLKNLFETGTADTATGRILLLPGKGWGIAELTLRFTRDGVSVLKERKFTFTDDADSVFPVKTAETKTSFGSRDGGSRTLDEEQIRYLVCDDARPAQKEFSLKYYGLSRSDLRTPAEKRFSRTLMILGGAVLLFGLNKKYKLLRRRRRGSKKRNRRALRFKRREDASADR